MPRQGLKCHRFWSVCVSDGVGFGGSSLSREAPQIPRFPPNWNHKKQSVASFSAPETSPPAESRARLRARARARAESSLTADRRSLNSSSKKRASLFRLSEFPFLHRDHRHQLSSAARARVRPAASRGRASAPASCLSPARVRPTSPTDTDSRISALGTARQWLADHSRLPATYA